MKLPGLVIRADASVRMGTGHLMRMLALAQAYANNGGEVTFVVAEAPPQVLQRVEWEGFQVRHIQAYPGGPEDAAATAAVAREVQALWIAVDGYQFGSEYQAVLKDLRFRVLFVDDYGHARHYYADLVLNQNVHADARWYTDREPHTRLLLGLDYVLLRKEFWAWRGWIRSNREVVRRMMVTLGGSDPANVTGRVLESLGRLPESDNMEITVVVGGGNPHQEALETLARRTRAKVQVHRNACSMPEWMAWADLAISSAGSTLWEIVFMQLPAIGLAIAPNQQPVVRFASCFSNVRFVDVMKAELELELPVAFRELLSVWPGQEIGKPAVDGYGVDRIVSAMAED